MGTLQQDFFQLCLQRGILRFGEFTLKSGRVSPYFFNAGGFDSGIALGAVGEHYARAIESSGIEFDMLFGPAYKGIPLATAVAVSFGARGRDVPFAYDRKEAKDHGEGGVIVGRPLQGRILVVDDVISAGTSVRHSLRLIAAAGAKPAGVAIAIDRQERGEGPRSARQELEADGLPVISVATLDDLLEFLEGHPELGSHAPAVDAYRARYGAH